MFSYNDRNKPKLRIKGFNDEWEIAKLSLIAEVKDGTHESPKHIQNGYPMITSKNLKSDGTIDLKDVYYISKCSYDDNIDHFYVVALRV